MIFPFRIRWQVPRPANNIFSFFPEFYGVTVKKIKKKLFSFTERTQKVHLPAIHYMQNKKHHPLKGKEIKMLKKLLSKLFCKAEVKKEVKPVPVRKVEWEQLTLPLD